MTFHIKSRTLFNFLICVFLVPSTFLKIEVLGPHFASIGRCQVFLCLTHALFTIYNIYGSKISCLLQIKRRRKFGDLG